MYMVKLLFQKLQIRPILAPGRDSQPPGALLKATTWGQVEASRPLCSRERQTINHPSLGTANCPAQECCSFFHLICPEFQNLSPHIVYSCYENVGLERKCRMVFFRVWTRHFLGSPAVWIKHPQSFNPCLHLLGLARDRWHKLRCLFQSQDRWEWSGGTDRVNGKWSKWGEVGVPAFDFEQLSRMWCFLK